MEFITIILILIFLVGIGIAYSVGKKFGRVQRDKYWEKQVPSLREDAIKRSRSVLKGHFSEQLAPYLPDFKYNPTECKFLGKPIDFLVFKGLDDKEIEEVIFVEVKSGKSGLNKNERSLRDAIKEKRVRWEEYRVPEKD
jgi:predicted Holliday junction resolvase-like endonuclease